MDKQTLLFGAEEEGINRRVTHSAHINDQFTFRIFGNELDINADMWKYVYF